MSNPKKHVLVVQDCRGIIMQLIVFDDKTICEEAVEHLERLIKKSAGVDHDVCMIKDIDDCSTFDEFLVAAKDSIEYYSDDLEEKE
jgi:hypothetical protein